jgi:hypothetical protein
MYQSPMIVDIEQGILRLDAIPGARKTVRGLQGIGVPVPCKLVTFWADNLVAAVNCRSICADTAFPRASDTLCLFLPLPAVPTFLRQGMGNLMENGVPGMLLIEGSHKSL